MTRTDARPRRGAVAAAVAVALSAPVAQGQEAIEEVVVTATKRTASMQDVPIAIQAMGAKALDEQGVKDFNDYVKYLPNVNFGGRGPGQNEVYIRGAAVDAINITVAESQGSAPNVALYVDEQPVTAGGRNLDVYVADMERIEVLPGPQGTLYGASSMAGTVRLITNKPVLNEFQASFKGSWMATEDGEDSTSGEVVLNLPLIDNKLAARAVLYNDNRGGYIDNVEGEFTADNSINPTFPGESVFYDEGTVFADGTTVGPGGVTIPVQKTTATNAALVEDDFNDASYAGGRLGLTYVISDYWDLLVQHTRQSLETEGVFDYDPEKGDLNVSRFTRDRLDDEFSQTAWTVNGRLANLDVIYTGAYLDREVSTNIDYTGYTNIGAFISGYQCEYLVGSFYHGLDNGYTTGYTYDPTIGGDPNIIECGTPANNVLINNEMTRWTHEFRIATEAGKTFEFNGGVFYEDFEILHVGNFNYGAPIDAGFAPIDINTNSTFDNAAANARGLVTAATQFRNDNTRTEEQIALFGEVTWNITDELSAAIGARYYDLEYGFKGYGAFRYGNRPLFVDDADPSNDIRPTRTGGRDYEVQLGDLEPISVDDTIVRVTARWAPTGDTMFFTTWSEGYRPPGFNRGAAAAGVFDPNAQNIRDDGTNCGTAVAINSNPATGFPGYCLPYVFESDTLENLEFGWKTSWMGNTLQWNGSIYKIDWENIQVSQFDSQNISIFTIVDNGGDAEILGIESDLTWSVTNNLTLFAGASYNDTELVFVDPAFDIVVADAGTPLPLTPEFQTSIRARYEWDMADSKTAFWQVGVKYAGEAINSLVDTPEEPNTFQDPYTIVDASVGLGDMQNGWRAELFATNLTDERAQLHINRQDFLERITTNRPRSIGLRLSYDF